MVADSSDSGPYKSRPIRAQQILSRPIKIEHLDHVTYVTPQMPLFGHERSRDPMG